MIIDAFTISAAVVAVVVIVTVATLMRAHQPADKSDS
mgnify:CR=1 FL=1|jgi:hypothetical protein